MEVDDEIIIMDESDSEPITDVNQSVVGMSDDTSANEEELRARPYQLDLESQALSRNTIIHLPTGSGKTFIAGQVIRRMMKDIKIPYSQGGKRTFFLVNTIPLVDQQVSVFSNMIPVSVTGYSSENKVDFWKLADWYEELEKTELLVMTAQILADMLCHNFIALENINLLVFDECHQAVSDHPMRQIMGFFENTPVEQQPRVIGLTATLLNCNVKVTKVAETLEQLETTFHATIATVDDLGQVCPFSTNPRECLLQYSAYRQTPQSLTVNTRLQQMGEFIRNLKVAEPSKTVSKVELKRGEKDLTIDPGFLSRKIANMILSIVGNIEELGLYGGSISILAHIVRMKRIQGQCKTKPEQSTFNIAITHLVQARGTIEKIMSTTTDGYQRLIRYSSEKVTMLLSLLSQYNPDYKGNRDINFSNNKLCALIFAKERFTAKILYNLIRIAKETNPKEFDFINHDFIVGFNNNPYNDTREPLMQKKHNQRAHLKFAARETNLLIATSIMEEGIDIPQCSLVLRFDIPTDYRSYTQSKGRARSKTSSYVVLVAKEDYSRFLGCYRGFQHIDQTISKLLVGKTHYRSPPTEEEISSTLYTKDIESFVVGNARVTETLAIRVVNRYCMSLPQDRFTLPLPSWIWTKTDDNRVIISITMPLSCPVKKRIQGDPMASIKSAKRSAAMHMCKQLYLQGELSDELLPKLRTLENLDEFAREKLFRHWLQEDKDLMQQAKKDNLHIPGPGTKNKLRKHQKMYPKCLQGNRDSSVFYLHIILLEPAYGQPEIPKEQVIHKLLKQRETYGVISCHPLPDLCQFPMFLNVGEVTTSIAVNYDKVTLTQHQFDEVKRFHHMLFSQVLNITKNFLTFDKKRGDNFYFVVPVCHNGTYSINWNTINQHHTIQPLTEPSVEEKQALNVTEETYKYSVVTPWYRGAMAPMRYLVTNVIEYMTPFSPFPTDSFESYAHYYSSKYNLNIMGPTSQPMLEVKCISGRMNCLLPRSSTISLMTNNSARRDADVFGDDQPSTFDESFVPEFCVRYSYPGVLWYKATLLPSILHRMTMLLQADELRLTIARETGLGITVLPEGQHWKPMKIDMHAVNKAIREREEPEKCYVPAVKKSTPETSPGHGRMRDSMLQLKLKSLDQKFPWEEELEPKVDLERDLHLVTDMDIECYNKFACTPANNELTKRTKTDTPNAPLHNKAPAICAPKRDRTIKLLSASASDRGPELKDILSALTTHRANDSLNLERMETLGDTFLKLATNLYLYTNHPDKAEGLLTTIKGQIVGNKNLFYCGLAKKLGGRMKTEVFLPKGDFLVSGFTVHDSILLKVEQHQIQPTFLLHIDLDPEEALSGDIWPQTEVTFMENFCQDKQTEDPNYIHHSMQIYLGKQAVADKTVADCVEAMIGAYLQSCGLAGALKILEWFDILPREDNPMELLNVKSSTPLSQGKVTREHINFLLDGTTKQIEKILNYTFNDISLLLEALSHPSYIKNRHTNCYQRLEFLGDAILDFLITAFIFENYPTLNPGQLTDLRSALVNNITFASYVVKLGLHKHIMYEHSSALHTAIMTFVEHQVQRSHAIDEHVLFLLYEEEQKMAEYIEVPKALGDVFESLAAAIYLDSGGSLDEVWHVYYTFMHAEIDSFAADIPRQAVRMIYEQTYASPRFGAPRGVGEDLSAMMVPLHFRHNGKSVLVHGFGRNKNQAKCAAAKIALRTLQLSP